MRIKRPGRKSYAADITKLSLRSKADNCLGRLDGSIFMRHVGPGTPLGSIVRRCSLQTHIRAPSISGSCRPSTMAFLTIHMPWINHNSSCSRLGLRSKKCQANITEVMLASPSTPSRSFRRTSPWFELVRRDVERFCRAYLKSGRKRPRIVVESFHP
jgi:hypothetical protein